MGTNTLTTRRGASIREFLRYYVLAAARRRRRSVAGIISEIKRNSADNQEVRRSGQLLVDDEELRQVMRHLARSQLLAPSGNLWSLTREGQKKLALYDERKENTHDSKDRAACLLLRWMGHLPSGKVVDVGTGDGYLAFRIADNGYKVLGIDSGCLEYSRNSIKAARQEAKARRMRVEFKRISVAELRRRQAKFDYAVSSEAVHCMRDQPACVKAIRDLLRPGGTFLCMDLHVGLQGFLEHGWHAFLALSKEEWRQLLLQTGFEELTFRRIGGHLIVKAQRPRAQRRGPGPRKP
jgi:2-polyprenyl-3-methyl-5-hydroxy-6-metoxy-1,4-benzoquinol methylase